MPQPSMLDIMHAALVQDGGVTRLFDNSNYATNDLCKKAMVSFRNKFYASKAKERRIIRRQYDNERTKYDDLGCSVEQTPFGWRLTISRTVFNAADFVDANGKPIDWKRVVDREEFSEDEIAVALAEPETETLRIFNTNGN